MKLNNNQIEILRHTRKRAPGGFFCGGDDDMRALVNFGFMRFCGRKSFVPDDYYALTLAGLNYLDSLDKKNL